MKFAALHMIEALTDAPAQTVFDEAKIDEAKIDEAKIDEAKVDEAG